MSGPCTKGSWWLRAPRSAGRRPSRRARPVSPRGGGDPKKGASRRAGVGAAFRGDPASVPPNGGDPAADAGSSAHRLRRGRLDGRSLGGHSMKRIAKGLMLAAAMGLVAPAVAQTTDDAKDTATQLKHDTTKTAREHKPGGETASDKAEDAKDQAKSTT